MSYYAKVVGNRVERVILADEAHMSNHRDSTPGTWIYMENCVTGPGDLYDRQAQVFYKPQPYAGWTLDKISWTWTSPTPMPTDGKHYTWSEYDRGWIEATLPG